MGYRRSDHQWIETRTRSTSFDNYRSDDNFFQCCRAINLSLLSLDESHNDYGIRIIRHNAELPAPKRAVLSFLDSKCFLSKGSLP